jgi:fructuronate reductase
VSATDLPRLSRATDGRPAAPVRIVHLGLGNFFRAHAAWYTEHAPDAAKWGIAAFTGRSGSAAESREAPDGLKTRLVRGPRGPPPAVVASRSPVPPRADLDAHRDFISNREDINVTHAL